MLVHLRRRESSFALEIGRIETGFKNETYTAEVRGAIEMLLQVPGMQQLIQEDQGLHIVWDVLADSSK